MYILNISEICKIRRTLEKDNSHNIKTGSLKRVKKLWLRWISRIVRKLLPDKFKKIVVRVDYTDLTETCVI